MTWEWTGDSSAKLMPSLSQLGHSYEDVGKCNNKAVFQLWVNGIFIGKEFYGNYDPHFEEQSSSHAQRGGLQVITITKDITLDPA